MAEYDALVLRLAKHPVGRMVTIVAENWNEMTPALRGLDQPERLKAVKLLDLRDEIKVQAAKVCPG